MKNLGSFFLTVFVVAIIVICIAFSLELAGVISLPSGISIKRVLSSTSTAASGEELYVPNYEATGLNAENKVTEDGSQTGTRRSS